jgi:hypothetical protein
VETTDRQQVGEPGSPPTLAATERNQIASADGESGSELGRPDSVDIGSCSRQQSPCEEIPKGRSQTKTVGRFEQTDGRRDQ